MTKTLQITGPEMTEKTLFDTYRLGNLVLANRIVMAPLTRTVRAQDWCRVSWLQPITVSALLPVC
ncbi:hypothetical protein KTT58_23685 [Pseudomonas viridiflava]|nr:hypothetical protein [Pseudomonas viridiflava]